MTKRLKAYNERTTATKNISLMYTLDTIALYLFANTDLCKYVLENIYVCIPLITITDKKKKIKMVRVVFYDHFGGRLRWGNCPICSA